MAHESIPLNTGKDIRFADRSCVCAVRSNNIYTNAYSSAKKQ